MNIDKTAMSHPSHPIRQAIGKLLGIWPATTLLILTLGTGMSATGAETTKDVPPDDAIKGQIRSTVPRHLKVDAVEVETLSSSEGTVKMAFKAKLLAQEDLYVEDKSVVNSTSVPTRLPAELQAQIPAPLRYLKQTQKEGGKGNIYGTFTATRRLDQWSFDAVVVESGLDQFGKPQGSFGADCLVGGTADADAAKKKYEDTLAGLKIKGDELIAKQKQNDDEIARKQAEQNAMLKKQAEEAAAALKQKLLEATDPGTVYEGVVTCDNDRQGVRIRFLEQNGTLVKCAIDNPAQLNEHRKFTGDISIPDKADGPNLVIGPEEETSYENPTWWIYRGSGSISLKLEADSWVGHGAFSPFGQNLSFKLTRVKQTASTNASDTNNSGQAAAVVPAQSATTNQSKDVVFSQALPPKAYRTESVADFAEALNHALNETQLKSGHQDPLGLNPDLHNTLTDYNGKLLGQPLHYTGKFIKISKFLFDKKIVIEMGPQTFLAVTPRVDEKNNLTQLQAGDEVEIVGEYNNIGKDLSDKWTLEVDAGQIITIRRNKSITHQP